MVAIRENEDRTKIQINDKRNEATERKAQKVEEEMILFTSAVTGACDQV